MPIYAYQCAECRHEVEVLQKISDAPLTDCPSCHRSSLVKKVTAAGFQLKGSGWYATDFKGNGTAKAKDSKAADGAAKEGEAKSDAAKPAETPAAGSKTAESASPSPAPAAGGSTGGPAPATP
jgi:putative FmdB family regulatory protein